MPKKRPTTKKEEAAQGAIVTEKAQGEIEVSTGIDAEVQAGKEAKEKAETEAKAQAEKEAKETAEADAKAQADKEAKEKAEHSAQTKMKVDTGVAYTTKTKDGIESHFRGGVKHTKELQEWEPDTFTEEQLQKVICDPHLSVKKIDG